MRGVSRCGGREPPGASQRSRPGRRAWQTRVLEVVGRAVTSLGIASLLPSIKEEVDEKVERMIHDMDEWREELGTETYVTHTDVTIAFNLAAQRLTFLGEYISDDTRRAKYMDAKKRARVTAPIDDLIGSLTEFDGKIACKPRALAILNAIKDTIDAQLAR